ncbi:trypsin-like peptidase domain-containing protein [Streptomyces sp. CRN 30]|uniref:trypsin-like peptidase domain-containing protein n=1 Tax=Streptomyces sp. CRN 30 TaxID=3075613 RepID=UPI002A81825A|nr:trypsin-like peptidase domain-containing protein [Streptomyces sp. CRN 30]
MFFSRTHRGRSRTRARLALTSAALVVVAGLTAAPGVRAAPEADDPLPRVTPQARAQELVQPATVFVQVDYLAYVLTDIEGFAFDGPFTWTEGCSGVIVEPTGYVATAGHCLDQSMEDGARGKAVEYAVGALVDEYGLDPYEGQQLQADVIAGNRRWTVEGNTNGSPPEREAHVQVGGDRVTWRTDAPAAGAAARVISVTPYSEGDVALLKVAQDELPAAELAPQRDIEVGQDVISIGYAYGDAEPGAEEISPTARSGKMSSIDTLGRHGPGNDFYETSAALSEGMSGGAAFNLDGQVVGLGSSQSSGNESANYIVPSSIVGEMLARNGVKSRPGRLDTLYRAGLADFYQGYYSDAIDKFDQVVAIMPEHRSAVVKRAKAAELKQRFGDQPKPAPAARAEEEGTPITLIAGIGAGVLLAAAVLVALLLRRRRRGEGTPPPEPPAGDRPPVVTADLGALPGHGHPGQPEAGRPAPDTREPTLPDPVPSYTVLPDEPVRCPQCRWPHEPDAVFCSHCGARLSQGQ